MKNYITFIYFDLLSMLTTFKMNCFFFFFFKCNQLCEVFCKKFYFPLEGIQKALKTQRKTYMTN